MARKQEVKLTKKDFDKEREDGRKPHQKYKAYLVLQHLLRETDENHILNADDFCELLTEDGIHAERRGIYRDIDEINLINIMCEERCSLEEAREILDSDVDDSIKLVVLKRTKSKKGYYVKNRRYDLDDIRLLAECINSSTMSLPS